MLDKLNEIEEKYRIMEARMSEPSVIADTATYTKLMKEYKYLSPIVAKYREYKKAKQQIADAQEMIDDAEDEEMRKFAADELSSAKDDVERLTNELRIMLIPRDPNDDRSVIVEIHACAGGEEAALFAAVLYRMYSMYCASQGYKFTLLHSNDTDLGGFREVTFLVEGDGVWSHFKFESGVHRVQRVPETESQGRIQTSTATVAVLPEVEPVEVEIKDSDLVFESCKSSGAGGQHINKTESAVRLTHKPSGIVVECDSERSQFQNKDRALEMLRAKLYDIKQREQDEMIAGTRRSQVGTGDRSEKIRTYNYPQSRITDHRINLSIYNMDSFLNGNINQIVEALITSETADKLKAEN